MTLQKAPKVDKRGICRLVEMRDERCAADILVLSQVCNLTDERICTPVQMRNRRRVDEAEEVLVALYSIPLRRYPHRDMLPSIETAEMYV